MSNRLTFSLASLVLIFALVFSAMPVLAHEGSAAHNSTNTNHVSIKSITIEGDAKLGNKANDRLDIIVEYNPAEANAPTDGESYHK